MKLSSLLFSLLAVLGFATHAQADTLKLGALQCVASNGVLLKTTRATRSGVAIESSWGMLKRTFVADLGVTGVEAQNLISLKDEEGVTRYVISLAIEAKARTSQNAVGTLLMAGNQLTPYIPIAAINCELALRN